jgi:transposase-like protein
MGKQNRRKYDADFKRNAVQLSLRSENSVQEVADDLGIHKDLIYQWRKQCDNHGEIAFPGNGAQALTPEQKRIKELEKKLKDVEMERDILKKAMAILTANIHVCIPLGKMLQCFFIFHIPVKNFSRAQ